MNATDIGCDGLPAVSTAARSVADRGVVAAHDAGAGLRRAGQRAGRQEEDEEGGEEERSSAHGADPYGGHAPARIR